jgi:leader peptidase (prepilin peptidase)/N-methyltransferase
MAGWNPSRVENLFSTWLRARHHRTTRGEVSSAIVSGPDLFDAWQPAGEMGRALFGFVLGGIAGSFVATLAVRWPEGRSASLGRSRCDGCGKALRPTELIPMISYLLARGRCRRCGVAIDKRHMAIEVAAAALGAFALMAQPGFSGLVTALFGWWLLALAAPDLEHQWLPDSLTLPLLPIGLLVGLAEIGPAVPDRLIGAAAGFLVLAAIAFVYQLLRGREGLGGGDPKLLAAIGAWIGWQQLPLVLMGAGLIGLLAVALTVLRGGAVRATDRLPLGTLMAVAAWPIWLIVSSELA